MSPFVVNSNSLFLCGTTNGAVTVVDAGTDLNTPTYSGDNWKIVAAVEAAAARTEICRAVEIFGKVVEGASLDKLCQDLLNSQVLVNRDGYQVRYLGADGGVNGGEGFEIGNNYLMKLNNLFGWGKYGVKSPEGRIGTVWNRYDVNAGEAVVDYAAAEVRAKETASELREWERRAAEKEEVLGHYKRIVEENKEVMKEMEMGKNWIKKVLEEKKGVIEEQRRVIKEKGVEIEDLMKSNGLVVNGDELKEAMVSCMSDLKRAISVTNRVLFANLILVAFLLLGLIYVVFLGR
ncbi:hypothetical protein LINGRAHAP2_LOCUS8569 [Linum grandiflorum]